MELSLGTQESLIPFAGTHGCFSTKKPTRNHPKDPLIHFDLVQWIVAETQPRRCWALDLIQSSDSAFLNSCTRRNSNGANQSFQYLILRPYSSLILVLTNLSPKRLVACLPRILLVLSTGSLLSEPTFESSILEPRSSRAFDCHLQHDSAHHRKHLQDPSRRNACFYSLLPQPRNPRWNHRPRQDPSRTNTSFENIEPDVKWRLRNDRDSGPIRPFARDDFLYRCVQGQTQPFAMEDSCLNPSIWTIKEVPYSILHEKEVSCSSPGSRLSVDWLNRSITGVPNFLLGEGLVLVGVIVRPCRKGGTGSKNVQINEFTSGQSFSRDQEAPAAPSPVSQVFHPGKLATSTSSATSFAASAFPKRGHCI